MGEIDYNTTSIGPYPRKTTRFYAHSNGIEARMGIKAFSPSRDNIDGHLPRLLLNYSTIPLSDRLQNLSALKERRGVSK